MSTPDEVAQRALDYIFGRASADVWDAVLCKKAMPPRPLEQHLTQMELVDESRLKRAEFLVTLYTGVLERVFPRMSPAEWLRIIAEDLQMPMPTLQALQRWDLVPRQQLEDPNAKIDLPAPGRTLAEQALSMTYNETRKGCADERPD